MVDVTLTDKQRADLLDYQLRQAKDVLQDVMVHFSETSLDHHTSPLCSALAECQCGFRQLLDNIKFVLGREKDDAV